MDFQIGNLATIIASAEGGGGEGHGVGWGIFYYVGIVFLTIFVFMVLARRGFRPHLFVGLPAKFAEHLYFFLKSITTAIIGPHGPNYIPFLMTLWLFIFVSNVYGLIFPYTPSADWSLNIGFAVVTFLYVQYEGIRLNGLFGHLKHFAGPKLGGLPIAFAMLISGLIFSVEIFSEVLKIFSLSIRLFGNIEGGHIVKDALDSIITDVNIGSMHIDSVPLGGLLLPIKFFTCILQAFIWCTLACVYLAAVTGHHEEEHEHVEGAHAHAHA